MRRLKQGNKLLVVLSTASVGMLASSLAFGQDPLCPARYPYPQSVLVAILSIRDDVSRPSASDRLSDRPTKTEKLWNLTRAPNTSYEEVCSALVDMVNRDILRNDAIKALTALQCTNAVNMLVQLARTTENEHIRNTCVVAVIRIGGTNMLDFAKEVIQDRKEKQFGYLDRYCVYQALAAYVGSDVETRTRQSTLRFLMDVVTSEPGFGSEYEVDRILCAASEQWRKSHEREAFLERFKETDNTTYYADQLKALQAIPAAERTHVEVHPLRMVSPAPPSAPQPASSTKLPASPASQPAP